MANDVMQFHVVGSVAGEPTEIISAFITDNAAHAPDPTLSAAALIVIWQTNNEANLMAALPDDYVLHGYKARRINNTGGPTAVLPVPGVNGGRGANSVSSGQGPVVLIDYFDNVGVPNRWRTGRMFLPGIAAGDLVENVIQAALTAAVQTFIDTVKQATGADGNGDNWTPVIWSRKHSQTFAPMAWGQSGVIGTQRRRLHPAL
jgi:hypothetical protein